MEAPALLQPERAAGYASMTGWSRDPAYPESDRALRDHVRVGRPAPTAFAGRALAPPAAATAGLHRRAGEPGHRVRRRPPARALFRAVALYLGNPDRADPDLPDHR